MRSHPGGTEHSRYLIELSFLPAGSRWLDMGAGGGETVELLRSMGNECTGIDLEPRGENVQKGDYLNAPYADSSFDGIISQCSFFLSGNVDRALSEAARMLRKGGKLVFSDVCADPAGLIMSLRKAGFAVRHMEDMTEQWKEYYLEALWREDEMPCHPPIKKCSYIMMICERM